MHATHESYSSMLLFVLIYLQNLNITAFQIAVLALPSH